MARTARTARAAGTTRTANARRRARAGLPALVREARERIEHWRRTRKKRSPMPEELWSAAVLAAQAHGVWSVAHELHVNYESLKGRVTRAGKGEDTPAEPAGGFVELRPALEAAKRGPSPCAVVELVEPDGTRLTLRLPPTSELDVGGLARALLERRS